MVYEYKPEMCMDGSINQMRFELGDTVTEIGPLSAALCDEEYSAIIKSCKSWKAAKLKCLEAIMMKMSYEVDTGVDGLSYGFNQRADRWRAMYDDLKKELSLTSVPDGLNGMPSPVCGEHYFHADMHCNSRKE